MTWLAPVFITLIISVACLLALVLTQRHIRKDRESLRLHQQAMESLKPARLPRVRKDRPSAIEQSGGID